MARAGWSTSPLVAVIFLPSIAIVSRLVVSTAGILAKQAGSPSFFHTQAHTQLYTAPLHLSWSQLGGKH